MGEAVLKVRKKSALDFADRMIMCNFAHTTDAATMCPNRAHTVAAVRN